MSPPIDDTEWAQRFATGPARSEDDDDADERFRKTLSYDPFPAIPAALLNSSDFYNYVAATGMVHPFEEDQLKSASYSIRIGDKVIYWNGSNKIKEKQLSSHENFAVPANSIVFIKTKEKFRLPPYIAMRFNLKINNVHRGILLGTGPLVDPGYEGHLLIPLHNLTTNTYYFQQNETFVWAEFTKTSPYVDFDPACHGRYANYNLHRKYQKFPKTKKNLKEWHYLNEESKTSVVSSISGTIAELKSFKTYVTYGAISTVVIFLLGFIFGFERPMLDFEGKVTHVIEKQDHVETTARQDHSRVDELEREVHTLQTQLATLSGSTDQGRITSIENRLGQIEEKLREITSQFDKK
jgi:deoxycytidine triphosphate deaminase